MRHIQILHGVNHWICTYYDGNFLHVHDSLNANHLTFGQYLELKKLYLHLKDSSVFQKVQQQPNFKDCGVFAIAFNTSVICGVKPELLNITSI